MQEAKAFQEKAREIGEKILKLDNALVVHHLDCDGITSGAIVSLALKTSGKAYKTFMLKQLNPETVKTIPESENYVFTDLGSGQLDLIKENFSDKKVFIIDHHQINGDQAKAEMVNVHSYGFNGGTDACGASTAAFCFKHLDNPLFYELGIVGLIGDMQDRDGVVGLNKILVEEAIEKQIVLKTTDLRMYGKVSRNLVNFLAFSTEPFLPGLTGNEKNCAIFLKENDIPTEREGKLLTYYQLNVFERKKLASAILSFASEKIGEEKAMDLVGDVYLFLKEGPDSELRDAYEFSTMMNACGRHDEPQAGLEVCLHGSNEWLEKARSLMTTHRFLISKGISTARKKTIDLGAFYFIDARGQVSDSVIGTVAGSIYTSGLLKQEKPIIAFAEDDKKNVKVSGRGTKALIQKGLDLAEVMRKSAEAAGGLGGGHNIAAGAFFPQTKQNIEKFLKKAKEVIEVQLQKQ